ncbi:MAG: glycosyltransferase family 2 protein [Clostridia bacterium]|nr:glycosyltransferase family 2 protein [Clostridia bacterium]
MKSPILYLVIPCYNEENVLNLTAPMFLDKVKLLVKQKKISAKSKVLFVNDGSKDSTWQIIEQLSASDKTYCGISLSRNRGHQNALLAGLMEAKDKCDITVSLDCDGQDDINAVDKMVEEYLNGCDIVYGVRSSRKSDTFFKRTTAQGFYKFLKFMGVETVYNHADYRLMSSSVLSELAKFEEVNLYLRGLVTLVGFKSTCVYYERNERIAGESKYPLKKMISLALDGITSFSVKPIRLITNFGLLVAFISLIGIVWSVVIALMGNSVSGWASTVSIVCFLGGIQLLSIGIIGEYVGKIYLETKHRPKYIIEKKTND